ncbi:hypothetical protein Tco_0178385 [Tanacetum coccineum]
MVINSPCLNNKKELAIPEQTATGKESTNPLMADSLPNWSSYKSIAKLIKFSKCIQRMNISCSLVADGISRERCHANVNEAELKKSVDELNLDR